MKPIQEKRDYHGMKLINNANFVCGIHVSSKHELETCEKYIHGKWSEKRKKIMS